MSCKKATVFIKLSGQLSIMLSDPKKNFKITSALSHKTEARILSVDFEVRNVLRRGKLGCFYSVDCLVFGS